MASLLEINYKSPVFIKIAGTAIIFLVIAYIWYIQSFSKNNDIILEKADTLQKIREKIENAKMSEIRLEQLTAELNRLFAQYKLIEELIPEKRDVADFINKIYLAAKEADANVVKLEQKTSAQQGYFFVDPYGLEIETTYNGLGKFLSLVANLPFTALVSNVRITTTTSQKYSIIASMTINAHHMEATIRAASLEDIGRKKISRPAGATTPEQQKQPEIQRAPKEPS